MQHTQGRAQSAWCGHPSTAFDWHTGTRQAATAAAGDDTHAVHGKCFREVRTQPQPLRALPLRAVRQAMRKPRA